MKTGEQLMNSRQLPTEFDWRDIGGRNMVTFDINQHQPFYCGACWIHAASSALNDRIKIMRNGRFPDVMLARQAMMNCIPAADGVGSPPGCNGGDSWMVHSFMHQQKIPDETCIAYAAVNQECTPLNVCRNCFRVDPPDPENPFVPGPCWGQPTYIGYGVSDYGQMKGEKAMKNEIYARGPITCSFVTSIDFVKNYANNAGVLKNGVFVDRTKYNESDVDHEMEVTGWGETADGTPYWVVRNSWGTYWGVAGWFNLERGTNALLVERDCAWSVPDFEELDRDMLQQVQGDYYSGVPGGTKNFDLKNASYIPQGSDPGPAQLAGRMVPSHSGATELASTAAIGAIVGGLLVSGVSRLWRRPRTMQSPLLG